MPTARHCLLATAAWLVAVGTLAWFGLGGFAVHVLALGAGLWIGVPLLLMGLTLGLARKRAGWRLVAGVLGLALTLSAGVALGDRVCAWEIARAKAAGERISQECSAFHRQTGRWPGTLAELGMPVPRLLRHAPGQDGSPSLWINDPRYLMGSWNYHLETRSWQFSD
jgi:hypothetical protein